MANFDIQRKWYLIDASDLILGRMSTEVANILTGKTKVSYTPHEDHGDHVIIINAAKVKLTGDKLNKKMYYSHSGYPGGLRTRSAKTMINDYPEEMVGKAIWGMIPHNKLGRKQVKKLHIYRDEVHGHEAQNPIVYKIKVKAKKEK